MPDDGDKLIGKIAKSLLREDDRRRAIWCPNCGAAVPLEEVRDTTGTQMFVTIVCPNCGGEVMPPSILAPTSFRKVEKPQRSRRSTSRVRRGDANTTEEEE